MTNKSWGKIGAMIGFLALLSTLIFAINGLQITDTQRYFGFTLVLMLGMFGYFNWFKEPTNSSARSKKL